MSHIHGPVAAPPVRSRGSDVARPVLSIMPAGRSDAATASLPLVLAVVARLEQVVDQESEALQESGSADLRDFNARKSQGLLELSRAARALDGKVAAAAGAPLRALRGKLERNAALLKTHLAAVQEVSSIMASALREADSDGTYAQFRALEN